MPEIRFGGWGEGTGSWNRSSLRGFDRSLGIADFTREEFENAWQ